MSLIFELVLFSLTNAAAAIRPHINYTFTFNFHTRLTIGPTLCAVRPTIGSSEIVTLVILRKLSKDSCLGQLSYDKCSLLYFASPRRVIASLNALFV